MKTTRRNFIKTGTLAAFFAGTDLLGAFGLIARASTDDLAQMPNEVLTDPFYYLSGEDFKKYIGARFSMIDEARATYIELAGVRQTVKPIRLAGRNNGAARRKASRETFTLTFNAPAGDFSQSTYKLWHPNLGQFKLFLVQGAVDGNQTMLHAVVNRI